MSEDLRIKVTYDIDDSKLQQSLKNVEKSTNSAVNGGNGSNSGPAQSRLQNEVKNAQKLNDHLKQLQEAQTKLFSMPGAERQLAKVNQEMAGIYGRYKSLASDSGAYLQNLAKQVELQKEAAKYSKLATQMEGSYSAHSDRQFAMLQQISGAVPGGGILNKFLGGARSSAMAGEAGGGGGLLSGGALAGGAAAAAAGVAALAIGAAVSKVSELAARSNELAQSASNATSQLGQLRSQIEKAGISKDVGSNSPGVVTVAGIQSWLGQQGNNFVTNALNSPAMIKQGIGQAISQGLGGDDRVAWDRIKTQGQDLQIDLARQKQSLDIQQQRTRRDFALEEKSWQIDTANTRFDLQKQIQRQEQDYTLAKQQYDQNHAGEMAAKQFDLEQKYAAQSFQIQKQRNLENFSISQSYKAQDYAISQSRAKTQFSISQSDRSYDFGVSQSRNQTEFNINRSRQREDFQTNLMKMAISGADSTSYLFNAIDFNRQQKRELEDFNRQKQYATADYSLAQGRDLRNFGLSQSYAKQDYQLGVSRDTQQFNLSQARNTQDYNISRQQAQDQRNLQLEDMAYSRKWQGIQLELQHNRNLEDSSIALQRFNQSLGLQSERFANQAGDINLDQALQTRDYNISAYRSLREQGYQEQDFAGAMRQKNPLAAYGQTLTDPAFAAASARYAQATGQEPIAYQVNAAIDDALNGPGARLARLINDPLSLFGGGGAGDKLKGLDYYGPGLASLNGGLSSGPNITFSPQHNVTFPAGGVGQGDLQQLYSDYQNDLRQLDSKYAKAINALAGGNVVF